MDINQRTNPETLKYYINDRVQWFDETTQSVREGKIVNVGHDKLYVIEGGDKLVFVTYDSVVSENPWNNTK